jgi:acetyl-CoA C-acetyltransferase
MKLDESVVVVSGLRSSFGKFGGKFKNVEITELGADVITSLINQTGISKDEIDEVWWGVGDSLTYKDMFTPVIARQTLLKAGLNPTVQSVTIDKACVSAMSAAYYLAGRIVLGEVNVGISGGATTFSHMPFVFNEGRFSGNKMGDITLSDPLFMLGYKEFNPVAVDASNIAIACDISREAQDEFAYMSHVKYGLALEKGKFIPEIAFIEGIDNDEIIYDEQYRENISLEKLNELTPIFGSKTCTAGNSPGLNDGAAAQLMTSKELAQKKGWDVLYSLLSINSIAINPDLIAVAPAFAIKKCLDELEMDIMDIDLIEINEAFACVPLATLKLLSNENFVKADYDYAVSNVFSYFRQPFDSHKFEILKQRTNVNGGAIAIGHPNTATGARLMFTAGYELKRKGGGIAVVALCGGLAQADASIIKV